MNEESKKSETDLTVEIIPAESNATEEAKTLLALLALGAKWEEEDRAKDTED